MGKLNVLELFAGTKSIGKAALELGMEVFSSDIDPAFGTDYCVDILDFDADRVPWIPDVIHASPPCTTFSIASFGHHWTGGRKAYVPKTEEAKTGMAIVRKTCELIRKFRPKFFYIENPVGMLRKLGIIERELIGKGAFVGRNTVTYCRYGDTRMKPTDVWTNNGRWEPRPMCRNGDSCHEAAPRGSKTGTQGLSNARERSVIPHELCLEMLSACMEESDAKRFLF